MKRTPRNTLQGTRAETLLRRDFYGAYLQARYLPAEDIEMPDAAAVFTEYGVE